MQKYVALYDLHWGYERKNGHKVALHDIKAINAALAFASDFKPDTIILGGDALDCGCISHHNHGKPGATEGMKLLEDAKGLIDNVIKPLESLKAKNYVYLIGNHEVWLQDLEELIPALEGFLDVQAVLKLDKGKWQVIPQGGAYHLGKLTFIHGDTISGGEHVAKNAVVNYEKNIRFGHFHTYQTYAKGSALEYKNGKTGVAVPCLCGKTPKYTRGRPNRWMQGFNFGYVDSGGFFTDYVAIIVNGRTVVNGKEYRG